MQTRNMTKMGKKVIGTIQTVQRSHQKKKIWMNTKKNLRTWISLELHYFLVYIFEIILLHRLYTLDVFIVKFLFFDQNKKNWVKIQDVRRFPRCQSLVGKGLDLFKTDLFCTVQIKDSCVVDTENRRFYLLSLRLIWDFARDWLQQKMLYLVLMHFIVDLTQKWCEKRIFMTLCCSLSLILRVRRDCGSKSFTSFSCSQ